MLSLLLETQFISDLHQSFAQSVVSPLVLMIQRIVAVESNSPDLVVWTGHMVSNKSCPAFKN